MFGEEPLTEERWWSAEGCDGAAWMLRRMWDQHGAAAMRKSKLFVCACTRSAWKWSLLGMERRAIETAERYADCQASLEELSEMHLALTLSPGRATRVTALCLLATRSSDVRHNDCMAAYHVRPSSPRESEWYVDPVIWVRDIFGDPFHPVNFDPAWRTPDVCTLAESAYRDRDFTLLPVLGDALLDAGCANEDVLAHCRAKTPHTRGCWVLDRILGKP